MQYPLDIKLQYCYRNNMSRDVRGDARGFIARVEAAREARGFGVYEFSEEIAQAGSYWSSWMSRHKVREGFPRGDILAAMANVLGVSISYLLGVSEDGTATSGAQVAEPAPEIQTVPLAILLERIGAWPYQGRAIEGVKASAGAGSGSTVPQGFDDARPVGGRRGRGPDPIQNVEITGDCMVDLLYPGDVVVVDTRQMPEIGDVVVAVRFHDEMIVKYLRANGEHQYLESKDGKTIIPLDQYIRVLGPAVLYQRRLR